MVIYGDCTSGFSTKHFDFMRYPDFCPINTARHVSSSGSYSISPSNLMIMCSSEFTKVHAMFDVTQPILYRDTRQRLS